VQTLIESITIVDKLLDYKVEEKNGLRNGEYAQGEK
jgi:hypothetical protein